MLFKTPSIGGQWASLHPEVRVVLGKLDELLSEWQIPTLTLTDAVRTLKEQEDIYWGEYLAPGISEEVARGKARKKPSWHLYSCAADFRGSQPWGKANEARVSDWLKQACPKPQWEVLFHDVGNGKHFHVACKDFGWRRRWEAGQSGTV